MNHISFSIYFHIYLANSCKENEMTKNVSMTKCEEIVL